MIDGREDIGLGKQFLNQLLVFLTKSVLYFMQQADDSFALLLQFFVGHNAVLHNFLKRWLLGYHLVNVYKSLVVEYHNGEVQEFKSLKVQEFISLKSLSVQGAATVTTETPAFIYNASTTRTGMSRRSGHRTAILNHPILFAVSPF